MLIVDEIQCVNLTEHLLFPQGQKQVESNTHYYSLGEKSDVIFFTFPFHI